MSDTEPSRDDIQTLLDYARRKYREERWPDAIALQPVRAALERVFPRPALPPAPAASKYEPSWALRRKRARR